jgi:hypothetical protein
LSMPITDTTLCHFRDMRFPSLKCHLTRGRAGACCAISRQLQ